MTLLQILKNQSIINEGNGTTKTVILKFPNGNGVKIEALESGMLMTLVNEINEPISEHQIVVNEFADAFDIVCDVFNMWKIGGVVRYNDTSIWKKDTVIMLMQSYTYDGRCEIDAWNELFKTEDAA